MSIATTSQAVTEKNLAIRIIIGVVLSAMTTLMLIFAFPSANIWIFGFICMVPMLIAEYRVLPKRWAFLGRIIGIDVWVFWLVTMLFGIKKETWFIQMVPVLTAVLSYFTVVSIREFNERTNYRWFVLHGMFDWVGFEMLRRFIPLVRSHGLIAHTVHTQPWMIQPVSIFSVYGLSLLLLLINYALAQGVFALIDRKWQLEGIPLIDKRLVNRWLVGAAATFVVWVAISLVILAGAPKNPETIRVAAVQNGVPVPAQWPPDQPQEERLNNLFEQTRIAAQQGAKLAVWPELGIGFDPHKEYTDEFKALAAETNATLVIGYGVSKEGEVGRNAAVPLTPAGQFLEIYGKTHVPPTGETRDPDGGKYPIYNTDLGTWGIIICHDANFTDSSRILTQKGARFLAIPTFEDYIPGFEKIFYIQMVFRSVENRIATIKADAAFSSAIIDPYGRVLALKSAAPEGSAFALVEDMPVMESGTLYTRLGDWMGWISLAGFIFFMIYPDIVKKRQEKKLSKSE